MNDAKKTTERKLDHLALFASDQTRSRERSTLFECVHLDHNSLPELCLDDIDMGAEIAGHSLKAPFMITGMTGGAEEAGRINRICARIAQDLGIAMGVGSQRAMIEDDSLTSTYQVRDVAPDIFLAGNIGGVQATQHGTDKVREALKKIEASALCIHLNPAQELAQPEGDRDFRGVLDAIRRLVDEMDIPVIVKETGAGLAPSVVTGLLKAGVSIMDVSGLGGTSWVGAEILRGKNVDPAMEQFWDWGIPTAPAVLYAARQGATVIASGGIRNGIDAAKAFSLGASLCGIAAPVIRALMTGDEADAARTMNDFITGLKSAMLLTGCDSVTKLRTAPKTVTEPLASWIRRKK